MDIRKHLKNLPPYAPIEPYDVLSQRLGIPPEDIVKMDANENPYGPSPKARQALAELQYPHIYPDPESRELRHALADFTGVPVGNLLAGSGADELIDLLLRVLLEPRDCVLNLPPTFGMYPFDTHVNAGQVVEVPRQEDFSLYIPAILKAVEQHHPKIVFLTTPNNPDGSFPPAAEIDTLLQLDLLVVVDEAYIEFTDNSGRLGEELSRIRQVNNRENLVVLRTFSKWAGLAGLRAGYGAFPDWLMPTLWKAKQPYNVNVAASTAAVASLQDIPLLAANVAKLRAERQRLYSRLSSLPFFKVYPSQANFILCKVIEQVEKPNLVRRGSGQDGPSSWPSYNTDDVGVGRVSNPPSTRQVGNSDSVGRVSNPPSTRQVGNSDSVRWVSNPPSTRHVGNLPYSAIEIKDRLAQRGILLRYYQTPRLQDCIRVSVGLQENTDKLMTALEEMA